MWPREWVEIYLYYSMTAALEGGEWSAACPGRNLPPGKIWYPFYRRLGRAPGPVWTGGKSHSHRDSIPDCPACGQSLYRLSYPAPIKCSVLYVKHNVNYMFIINLVYTTFTCMATQSILHHGISPQLCLLLFWWCNSRRKMKEVK